MRVKYLMSVMTLMISLSLVSCSPIEVTAYRIVIGAKAGLANFRANHPECQFDGKTGLSTHTEIAPCEDNNRITAAKDVIIDAVEVYCSGGQFETGGPCNAPKKGMNGYQVAVDKLTAAIANYKQVIADVKGVI